jgi:hypothetical protein
MAGKVIEAFVWLHTSGRRASVYGACPWHSDAEKMDWAMACDGFTILHPDGTIGIGRPPFATREEAQAWVDANPRFSGMRQD